MMEEKKKKSKEEKEHDREQERLLSVLPMRKHFLKPFFDFLDKHIEDERKPSLKLTRQFCADNGLDIEKVISWAESFEAYDDQGILWNIEEAYEEVMNRD